MIIQLAGWRRLYCGSEWAHKTGKHRLTNEFDQTTHIVFFCGAFPCVFTFSSFSVWYFTWKTFTTHHSSIHCWETHDRSVFVVDFVLSKGLQTSMEPSTALKKVWNLIWKGELEECTKVESVFSEWFWAISRPYKRRWLDESNAELLLKGKVTDSKSSKKVWLFTAHFGYWDFLQRKFSLLPPFHLIASLNPTACYWKF